MFEGRVKDLCAKRCAVAVLKAGLAAKRAAHDAQFDQENAEIIDALRRATEERDVAELFLRNLVVNNFIVYGEKKPHPNLGVREHVRVLYDEKEALEWARLGMPDLLILPRKPFERMAKALAGDNLVLGGALGEIVRFEKVPSATIAKDLGDG